MIYLVALASELVIYLDAAHIHQWRAPPSKAATALEFPRAWHVLLGSTGLDLCAGCRGRGAVGGCFPPGWCLGEGGGGSLGRGAKKQAFKGIHGDRTICMRHKAGEVRRRTPPIPGTPPLHSGHPSGDVGPHQSGPPAPGAALYSNVIGPPERQFAGSVWLDLVRAAVGGTQCVCCRLGWCLCSAGSAERRLAHPMRAGGGADFSSCSGAATFSP